MKLKRTYLLMLSALSAHAFATEPNNNTYQIQGEISYNYSDLDNKHHNDDHRLSGSYISISGKHEFLPETFVFVDLGGGQNDDYVLDDFSIADEFNLEINQLLIKGKKDGFDYRIGRMFTPMGFYHEDELNVHNFFDSSNKTTRFMDGLDASLTHSKNNDSLKANVFIGTRLDDADVSTIVGGNVIFSRADFGHFNIGYANTRLSDEVVYEYHSGVTSDEIQSVDLTFFHESDKLNFVIRADHQEIEEIGSKQEIYSKIGYKINRITPYLATTLTSIDYKTEDLFIKKDDVSLYSAGFEMELRNSLTIYGEYSYFDGESSNTASTIETTENMYRAGLKFNY